MHPSIQHVHFDCDPTPETIELINKMAQAAYNTPMKNTPLLTPESVGKYYRTYNQCRIKIVEYNPHKDPYPYKDNYGMTYANTGAYSLINTPHPLDIVAEWVDEPKLVPLPKEMPTDWHNLFADLIHNRMSPSAFYKKISETYGTPAPKPELPSVEELRMDIINTWGKPDCTSINELANYIANKYSLYPREWWMRLEKGDKFMFDNGAIREVRRFDGIIDKSNGTVFLGNKESDVRYLIDYCHPYTEPTPSEKFIASLTDEQKQLLKTIDDKLEMLNKV